MSRVGAQSTFALWLFSYLLCVSICLIPPVFPYLCQSTVSYITVYLHSHLVQKKCLPKQRNLNLSKRTHSQRLCEAISVAMWHLIQMGCQLKSSFCRVPFDGFDGRFLVVRISPTRTRELNSSPTDPLAGEDIRTTGCCPVPRRDHLWHCYHHLSATRPSALCLTPWLRWARALFAAVGHYALGDEDA
jgi:hypothetical protein